jgi:hypothetical protein
MYNAMGQRWICVFLALNKLSTQAIHGEHVIALWPGCNRLLDCDQVSAPAAICPNSG